MGDGLRRAKAAAAATRKKEKPNYDKFLTPEQALAIERAISGGYHARDDYPPFALVSFEDRPRYHQYMVRVLRDLTK